MGQAKRRGTPEERAAQAQAKIDEQKPESINCNQCQAVIPKELLVTMDTRNIPGIDFAFSGDCPSCKHVTWAVKGQQAALAALQRAVQRRIRREKVDGMLQGAGA